MPMPTTTIGQALKLVSPGITVQPSYTYFVATAFPSYAAGLSAGYPAVANGTTSYNYSSGDFVSLVGTDAEAAIGASITMIDNAAGLTMSALGNSSADIVAFGLSQALYRGSSSIAGLGIPPDWVNNALEYDFVLLPLGQNSTDLRVTVSHELLHSVGLLDVVQSAGNLFSGDEDSARYTLMSYQVHPGEGRYATELQIYDIAALQSLYGRDTSFGAGTTVYSQFTEAAEPFLGSDRIFSIWDASGTDAINASELSQAALIDLRPGYFSSIGPGASVLVSAGTNPSVTQMGTLNISIAFGAYIENAIGSTNGDFIVGNLLSNKLEGGGGADVIYAEGRDSIHEAGDGTYDQVTKDNESRTEQAPTGVIGFVTDKTSQIDHLLGGAGDDYLHGGRGDDLIEGGADNDYIIGGAGDDEIWGGDKDSDLGAADGLDKVDYSSATSPVTVTILGDGSTASISVADSLGGTDTLCSIETIVGTSVRDVFRFGGVLDTGYALTLDAQGGQNQDDMLNFAAMGTGFELVPTATGAVLTSKPGNGHSGGGTITLLNFHTQIVGSDYDDTITDDSSGEKRVNGGYGNDVITIGGIGPAMLRGGGGDDILTGGDGNDVLVGGTGANILHGGAGSDLLQIADRQGLLVGDSDTLDGGDGADYLLVSTLSLDATLSGGAGNDVIDTVNGYVDTTVLFGAGDGHDMILDRGEWGSEDYQPANVKLDLSTLTKSQVTFVWDPQVLLDDSPPTPDAPGRLVMVGDLAIVMNATGDSIFLSNFRGSSTYSDDPGEAFDPPYAESWEWFTLDFLPPIVFADGELEVADFNGANPAIATQIGPVAQYAVALDEYLAAVAAAPGANDGTPGDDDLRGSRGDDVIAGGDGDDGFHSSGGEDAIDGGAGSDTLYVFGARLDFIITRDAATGDLILEDRTGLEGKVTAKSVEKVYFATDNAEYSPGDLVAGFWGTPGDDALIEGDAGDNLLYGLAGDDSLAGGGGDDVMAGGPGNDIYHVADAGDVVVEASGEGTDVVYTSVSYTLAAGQAVEILSTTSNAGTSPLTLVGNGFQQIIYGNAGANLLAGGGGSDVLIGLAGNDTYLVADGTEQVIEAAGGGTDVVYTSVSYTLAAGQEVEILSTTSNAGTAAINLIGNELANTIYGNAGANLLAGGGGADVLIGLGGNDTYLVAGGGEQLVEAAGGGTDVVYTAVSYALASGQEIEILSTTSNAGTAAIDLTGNAFANTIYGNSGVNVLNGGSGNDGLIGLGGADTFSFTTALGAGNVDAIGDFVSGADKIALDDAVFTGLGLGSLPAGAFVTGSAAGDADDRIIYNNATGQLFFDADGNGAGAAVLFATLQGAPAIIASDFLVT